MAQSKWNDGWKIGGACAALIIFFWLFGEPGLFIVAGIQIGILVGMWLYPGKNWTSNDKVSQENDMGIKPDEKLVFAFKLDGKIISVWQGETATCKVWNGWSWEPGTFWASDPFSEDAEKLSPEQIEKITGRSWPLKDGLA